MTDDSYGSDYAEPDIGLDAIIDLEQTTGSAYGVDDGLSTETVEGTGEGPSFLSLLESPAGAPFRIRDFSRLSTTVEHGDAISELKWYNQQSANGLCDPASVAMVVSEFKGIENSQSLELFVAATAVGLGVLEYDGEAWSGVPADGTVKELEAFGIDARVEHGGTLGDLARYLDENRSIILTVDSSEFWEGINDDYAAADTGGDHAVVITGIDEAEQLVYVNDPGDPDGAGKAVPFDVFLEAWDDSNFEMVVTEEAPADATAELPAAATAGTEAAAGLEPEETPGAPATPPSGTDLGEAAVAAGVGAATGAVILPVFLAGGLLARARAQSRKPGLRRSPAFGPTPPREDKLGR